MKQLKEKLARKSFMFRTWSKKSFFSLLLITSLSGCTNDDVISEPIIQSSSKLNLTVDVNPPQSRGVLEGNALADGSEIGILLDDGASTEYDAVDNIKFTAVREDGSQKWQPEKDIVLSGTTGTLYAYYPYAQGTDLSAIPVETASQTDYLYATPVSNVNDDNANVAITLNHMLSNVKVAIDRGTYVGTGNITNITIQSDGFATGGTFNAAQATPGFTSVTGVNEDITQAVNTTLGGTAANIMVVPTGNSKTLTFTVTIDGENYTATSTDIELEEGNSYEYTLSANSMFLSVASVGVTPWNPVPKESLTLEKYNAWKFLDNGVYAVAADGSPVEVANADESCIGVALIVNDALTPQRIMIEKNETDNSTSIQTAYTTDGATNNQYTLFCWGVRNETYNVPTFTGTGGGWDDTGNYLVREDGTCEESEFALSTDYTTWTDGMVSDLDGKSNTKQIAAVSTTGTTPEYAYIKTYYTTFNQTSTENQGYTDWYIPAGGQLALMFMNMNSINEALDKINGKPLAEIGYWCSTRYDSENAWSIDFETGAIGEDYMNNESRIRFIRDIIPTNN